MKQTNYHLFDFLDFDTELKTDESPVSYTHLTLPTN